MNKKEIRLLSDNAISAATDDGLGFNTYANAITGVILGNRGPLVIGVYGEWGSGKTSLLQLVSSNLSDQPFIIPIWFNAWKYEKEEHPIVPLIATIIRELEKYSSFSEKMAEKLDSLINALRSTAYGLSTTTKIKLPGFAEIEASFVAKDMVDRAKGLSSDPLLDKSLYYNSFEKLSNQKFDNRIKVVVFIDDLDRCFPNSAIKLLESIKLVLSQDGFIFVMGMARSIIEGYLKHIYAEKYGIKNFESRLYLDKIVQVPFPIPPHQGRMETFWLLLLENVDEEARLELQDLQKIINAAAGSNPRATIRFINNLLIDRAINEELSIQGSMEKIPIEFFAVSRSLQERHYTVYQILIRSSEFCNRVVKWADERIEELAKSTIEAEALLANTILGSPDLKELIRSEQGERWFKDNEMRKSTVEFLNIQRPEPLTSEDIDWLSEIDDDDDWLSDIKDSTGGLILDPADTAELSHEEDKD